MRICVSINHSDIFFPVIAKLMCTTDRSTSRIFWWLIRFAKKQKHEYAEACPVVTQIFACNFCMWSLWDIWQTVPSYPVLCHYLWLITKQPSYPRDYCVTKENIRFVWKFKIQYSWFASGEQNWFKYLALIRSSERECG